MHLELIRRPMVIERISRRCVVYVRDAVWRIDRSTDRDIDRAFLVSPI